MIGLLVLIGCGDPRLDQALQSPDPAHSLELVHAYLLDHPGDPLAWELAGDLALSRELDGDRQDTAAALDAYGHIADPSPRVLAKQAVALRLAWDLDDAESLALQAVDQGATAGLFGLGGREGLRATVAHGWGGDAPGFDIGEGDWGVAIAPAAGLLAAETPNGALEHAIPPLMELGLARRAPGDLPFLGPEEPVMRSHVGWVRESDSPGCVPGTPVDMDWVRGVQIFVNACATTCDASRMSMADYIACGEYCGGGKHPGISGVSTDIRAACTGRSSGRACEVQVEVHDHTRRWTTTDAVLWLPQDEHQVQFAASAALGIDAPALADRLLTGQVAMGDPIGLVDWRGGWTRVHARPDGVRVWVAGMVFHDGVRVE